MLFQEIAERRVCMQGRGGEETELEFDEEFVAGSDIQHFRRQVNTHNFHNPSMRCKVLLRMQAQMIQYMKLDVTFFSPAYTEAKEEEEEVLFYLLSAGQTSCCTVGEKGGASPLCSSAYTWCSLLCVLVPRCMACLIHAFVFYSAACQTCLS